MPGVGSAALAEHVRQQNWDTCFISYATPGEQAGSARFDTQICLRGRQFMSYCMHACKHQISFLNMSTWVRCRRSDCNYQSASCCGPGGGTKWGKHSFCSDAAVRPAGSQCITAIPRLDSCSPGSRVARSQLAAGSPCAIQFRALWKSLPSGTSSKHCLADDEWFYAFQVFLLLIVLPLRMIPLTPIKNCPLHAERFYHKRSFASSFH